MPPILVEQTSFKVLPDDNRVLEPPDPFSNSEVKQYIADGSVGLPHVRVGHRQAFNSKKAHSERSGPFFMSEKNCLCVNSAKTPSS